MELQDIQDIIKELEVQLSNMVVGTKMYLENASLTDIGAKISETSKSLSIKNSIEDWNSRLEKCQDIINTQKYQINTQCKEVSLLKKKLKELENENSNLKIQLKASDKLFNTKVEKQGKELESLKYKLKELEAENKILKEEQINKNIIIQKSEHYTQNQIPEKENLEKSHYQVLEDKLTNAEKKIKELEGHFSTHNEQITTLKKLYESKSQSELIEKLDEIEAEIQRILNMQDKKFTSLKIITEEGE